MIPRLLIQELHKWSADSQRKPLILRGARQVGKTTVIRQFGRQYDQYIELNLEKTEHRLIFERDYSFEQILDAIFFLSDASRHVPNTLIFIDEIQNSPEAVSKLRFFAEDAPHLQVIAAGSLLESLIDKTISFPVGRVNYLALRPCSFYEFLLASGDNKLLGYIDAQDIPDYAHDRLSELFRRYTIIGGMPEVLQHYIHYQDLSALRMIYERLIVSYQDDIEKYASTNMQGHILRHILLASFQYAGSRITFEKFGESNYRSRDMAEAFRTLEKTMLLKLIYPVTGLKMPAEIKTRRAPKLIMLDTGLVNFSSGTQKQLFLSSLIDEGYKGRIIEHIVAQELMTKTHSVQPALNFWVRESRNSQAEIDFLFPYEDMLLPVEVKSGPSGSLRSLHQFMDAAPHQIAIRLYAGPLKLEEAATQNGKPFRLLNIPYYLIARLEDVITHILY